MIRQSLMCGLCEGDYLAWGVCKNNCIRTDTSVVEVSSHESYCFCPYHADLFNNPRTISQVLDAIDDIAKSPPKTDG